ncbi:hypothetical protein DL98DRAFT_432673, partial [Cadophora sp. DSE1049]
NRETVENIYLPEIEERLRQEDPSIDRFFWFDWRLRSSEDQVNAGLLDLNDYTTFWKPSMEIHVDQSPSAVLHRIKLQLSEDSERLLKGRVRILNYRKLSFCVWRPLKDVIEDFPLAVCDRTTVSNSELIASDHVRQAFVGESFYLRPNDTHKWFYLSKQQPDEALIMKMFDSQESAKAKFCPHASFRMPNGIQGTRPRRTIEAHVMVFNYQKAG